MEKEQTQIIDSELSNPALTNRRRKLLPWWIKTFCWLFMIFGVLAPTGLVLGLLGMSFNLALYGFETTEPLSLTGLFVISIMLYKGLTAFGLWTEKDWAINLGMVDAIAGVLICIGAMIYFPFMDEDGTTSIRFEIILLIPYFFKLRKIQKEWNLLGNTH